MTSFGGLIYLFVISWKLSLVMLATIPVIGILAGVYGKKVEQLSKDTQKALASATEIAAEAIGGVRTVRAFAREAEIVGRYGSHIGESYALGKRFAFMFGAFSGSLITISGCALGGILFFGGTLVQVGEMTAGVLTSYLIYCLVIGGGLGGLAAAFGDIMRAAGATVRVFELLDTFSPVVPIDDGEELSRDHFQGGVEFEHVHFAYPARPGRVVLRDFSFRVEPGQTVALVGPSGGGKTTVVSLIERFYEPTSGRISLRVDGAGSTGAGSTLSDYSPSSVHRAVGLVAQEPQLFAMSIRDNIAFGVPGRRGTTTTMATKTGTGSARGGRRTGGGSRRSSRASEVGDHGAVGPTMADIERAARLANAYDFIVSLPDGFDTMVGERGSRLSGGQKQRIAIARALLLDPKLLLLDEATSALDAESEQLVQAALDRLMEGRTTLIVAHRLSTVVEADVVVVVDNGQVAARGTHDELIQSSDLYRALVSKQLVAIGGSGGGGGGGGGGKQLQGMDGEMKQQQP